MHINFTPPICLALLTCAFVTADTAVAQTINDAYLDDLYPPAIPLGEPHPGGWNDLFNATDGRVKVDRDVLLEREPALKFEVADAASGARRASAEALVPAKPGQLYRYSAAYRTAEPTEGNLGGYGFLTLHWLGPDGRTLPTRDKLMSRPGAETDWTSREIKAIAPPGATQAKLGLVAGWYTPNESSASWFGQIEWTAMQPAPIRLSLRPRVLRSIDEPMTIRVERTYAPNLTTDGRFIVQVQDEQGNTLREWIEPILITLPWQTTLRLPPEAANGTVSVAIEPVRSQPGYTGFDVSEPILVADTDLSPRIRDGRFVLDGRKRLVLGAYHTQPNDYPAIKAAGFNAVLIKHYDAEEAKAEYDELARLGLYGIAHLGGGGQTLMNRIRTKEVVETLRDHPALLAWNLMDEPTRKGIGPREIAEHGQWVQSLSPNVPTTVNLTGVYQFDRFGSTVDAFSVDPYPIYFWSGLRKPGDPPADLANVTRWMNLARESTPADRAIIGIVECFTFDAEQHPPATGDELRNMIAQMIASGAAAVMVYSVHDTGGWNLIEQPQFETLTAINRELTELEDWLVTDPVPVGTAGPTISSNKPDRLVVATWLHGGESLTVLINLDRSPLSITIDGEQQTLDPLAVKWIKP